MSCDEIPGLKRHDGATRIFLNTHGTDAEGVCEELIQLLRYFEQTTGENAAGSHSRKIEKLQKRCCFTLPPTEELISVSW